ncbi:MAG TPA: hypothetical protein VFR20_12070 [Burkholderiaceae bacterium]|nr:hypothetical protein [Burkholderiaceae bacterium]
MPSNSRRAFLMGRRTLRTPWEAFCQHMNRAMEGTFYDFGEQNGVGSARLTPAHSSDVQRARELCVEHGVTMALDGVQHASALDDFPVLWIDPGRDMAECKRIADDSPYWFVQPGCMLGELEAVGLRQFRDLPAHLTVAAWLADRGLCDWRTGETYKSGLQHASVMLADGTRATLGPFGENSHQPLEGLTLQRLVPALFEQSTSQAAQTCRGQEFWPARYRLDALLPVPGQTVNLAHLLLGHGGDLGWVDWVVLDERVDNEIEASYFPRFSTNHEAHDDDTWLAASDADSQVKYVFDPSNLFPFPGQNL